MPKRILRIFFLISPVSKKFANNAVLHSAVRKNSALNGGKLVFTKRFSSFKGF